MRLPRVTPGQIDKGVGFPTGGGRQHMRLWHWLFGHPIEHVVADIHYLVSGGIATKLSCRCGWSIGPTLNFVERK